MQSIQFVTLIAALILTQSIAAADPLRNAASPFGKLQAQLDALTTRIQALEESTPNQSIQGRSYCSVLNLQIMRGRSTNQSEELQNNIIRRKVSFSGGVLEGLLDSNVLNNQLDDGTVNAGSVATLPLLTATYTQTDSKLDVFFENGDTANWYVSKDGSLIHGSNIQHLAFGPPGAPPIVTVGLLRSWTLVETDPNDLCDAEDQ